MTEYDRYRNGIQKLFFLTDKDGEAIPFKLNPVQDRVLKNMQGMDIILKSRQQGMSSLILAMFALDFIMIENIKCVVISHEAAATKRLFDRVKYYLESIKRTFPGELPYTLKYNSRFELTNTQKNSTFYIGTAGARAFGHGDTINNLHVSEISRWENQETTMLGLLQAVPKSGKIFIESTANGFGNYFYNLWIKNYDKPGATFKGHFIPWFETPEYQMEWKNQEFGEYELELLNKFHLTKEQMMWRRWKIDQINDDPEDPIHFQEQFPSTPEEAFIVSGNPVWSPTLLKWYMLKTDKPKIVGGLIGYNPITIEENNKGFLKIWKHPNEFHAYVIGADVSEGKMVAEGEDSRETDYSCAQVIDQNTYEVVAEWHGRLEPDLFGREVEKLGRYYNDALVAVERNNMGISTLIALRDLFYPHMYYRERFGLIADKLTTELGWVTDHSTKEMAISDTTRLLRDKRLWVYSDKLVEEMSSFVRDANGNARAVASAHDDRVMAFLIACEMLGKHKTSERGNSIEVADNDPGTFFFEGVAFNSEGMPINPEDGDGGMDMSI